MGIGDWGLGIGDWVYSFEYSHNDSSFKLINNNKGLTCQLMAHPNIENVLSCFYEISFPNHITVSSLYLGIKLG